LTAQPMKILLICESFSARLSGGKVARFLDRILTMHGHEVEIVVTGVLDETSTRDRGNPPTLLAHRGRARRLVSLLSRDDVPANFRQLVETFSPDVAHFASFDHTKSPSLYHHCKSKNIRTVLQPWTMHFYCAQGFGYRDNESCDSCLHTGYLTAFRKGCATPRGALGQMERNALHQVALETADMFLSSNRDLDAILRTYGIGEDRITRFPVAFDVEQVKAINAARGDYYIYYGQAVAHKGASFLIDLFSQLPDKKLRLYPMTTVDSQGLPPNIEIHNGYGWHNGLTDAIANAKAVLVPSLWRTSTEYSLCEAMAMKKPVVAFNVGAHQELLVDGDSAMVVQTRDKADFKRALDELDQDEALYTRLSTRGAARMAEVNEPARLHAQLMHAYHSR
jgi:glycosyltransferase involved in cell wall biosynthesis